MPTENSIPTAAQKKAISNRVYKFGYKRLAAMLPGNKSYHHVYNRCNGFENLTIANINEWSKIMDEADRRDGVKL